MTQFGLHGLTEHVPGSDLSFQLYHLRCDCIVNQEWNCIVFSVVRGMLTWSVALSLFLHEGLPLSSSCFCQLTSPSATVSHSGSAFSHFQIISLTCSWQTSLTAWNQLVKSSATSSRTTTGGWSMLSSSQAQSSSVYSSRQLNTSGRASEKLPVPLEAHNISATSNSLSISPPAGWRCTAAGVMFVVMAMYWGEMCVFCS